MTAPAHEYPNLALIRQGIEYNFVVKVRKLELLMRPLSIMEEDQITQEVILAMKDLEEVQKTSIRQTSLLSIKKLSRASTSDVGAKDGKIHEIELERMTPGEIDSIFKQYVAGCDKLSPMLEDYDKETVKKWIEHLKKNSTDMATTLIESSFLELVAICRHLLTTEESPEAK